jgi:predicted signal transduction protein with EAL and GGDEF domain
VLRLAARLLASLEHPVQLDGVPIRITASIGAALTEEHGRDYGQLMRHADVAMYAAKRGRTGPVVYSPDLDLHSTNRLGLEAELVQAVEYGHLVLHYQPSYGLSDGRIRRVEALVRWRHPSRGLLGPAEFLPLAEETGFIRVITRYVLRQALDQVVRWRSQGLDVPVSVNISAHDVADPAFSTEVCDLLAERGLLGSSLVLELTETALMADAELSIKHLRAITEGGVGLALDDFGAGYSSLIYLSRLPATHLKIDGSLVRNVADNPADARIVHSA